MSHRKINKAFNLSVHSINFCLNNDFMKLNCAWAILAILTNTFSIFLMFQLLWINLPFLHGLDEHSSTSRSQLTPV